MASGDKYFKKTNSVITTEQVLRSIIREDANGKPFLKTNHSTVSCPAIAGLNVTDVTHNSLKLNWTDNGEVLFDIYYGPSPLTSPDENTTPTTTSAINEKTISGLTENTAYSFYVRSACGSAWSQINQTTIIYVSPYILNWYNLMSVKPSQGLLTALNTLADGSYADGDFSEADYVLISSGMETEEQASSPLFHSGGIVPVTKINEIPPTQVVTWDVNGFNRSDVNPFTMLDSNFNLLTQGLKYTLNSGFVGCFGQITQNNFSGTQLFHGCQSAPPGAATNPTVRLSRTQSTTVITNNSRALNSNFLTNAATTKAKLNGVTNTPIWYGSLRTASNQNRTFFNTVLSANSISASLAIPVSNYGLLGEIFYDADNDETIYSQCPHKEILRAKIIGSGLIDYSRLGARLNTFFVSRGLTPYT